MLSRKKEPPKREEQESQDDKPKASSSHMSCPSATTTKRGDKRKSTESDPHDKDSNEYLRRKHNFIKSTILVDYQPDVCKDYKETGFCGFGDSCKFLHDRSDYKHGWQLEQEYVKSQLKSKEDDGKSLNKDSEKNEKDEDDVSKCKICHETYKDPVVTKCKHYFCGTCADKECNVKCYVCEKPTSGIFKIAKLDNILKK